MARHSCPGFGNLLSSIDEKWSLSAKDWGLTCPTAPAFLYSNKSEDTWTRGNVHNSPRKETSQQQQPVMSRVPEQYKLGWTSVAQ